MKRLLSWLRKYRLFFFLLAIFVVNYSLAAILKGTIRATMFLSIIESVLIIIIVNWNSIRDYYCKHKKLIYIMLILLSLTGMYLIYKATLPHFDKSLTDYYWSNRDKFKKEWGFDGFNLHHITPEYFDRFISFDETQPSYSAYINKLNDIQKEMQLVDNKENEFRSKLYKLEKEPQKNVSQIETIKSELERLHSQWIELNFYLLLIDGYLRDYKWKIILTPKWDQIKDAINSGEFYATVFSTFLSTILNIIVIVITLRANRKLSLDMQKMTNESNDKLQRTTALSPMVQEKTKLYAQLTEKLIMIYKQCLKLQIESATVIHDVESEINYHFLVSEKVAKLIHEFIQLARIEQRSDDFKAQLDQKLMQIRKEMSLDLQQI